jgi:hypothetical protein
MPSAPDRRDVEQRQPDELALAGRPAVALGRQQADAGGEPGRDVPARHDVVDGLRRPVRPGHRREAHGAVDRVVDRRRAVVAADDVQHDEVRPAGRSRS